MCNKSESIVKIAVALSKFNGEVKMIEKDAANPHFKSDYATLDTIIQHVRPILHKHGLSVMQFPGGDGEKLTMRTMLLHESGEWLESELLTMIPTKKDPQGIGSATTYSRRYQLASMLSLSLGDDDDANAASTTPVKHEHRQEQRQDQSAEQSAHMISPKQIGLIKMLAGKKKKKVEELLKPGFTLEHLTSSQASDLIKKIESMPEPSAQSVPSDDLPF